MSSTSPVIIIDTREDRVSSVRALFARKGIPVQHIPSWDRAVEALEEAPTTPLTLIGLELLLEEEGDAAAAASMQLMMLGIPAVLFYQPESGYAVQRLQSFAHFSSYLLWPASDNQLIEACGELLPRLHASTLPPGTPAPPRSSGPPPIPARRFRNRPNTGWHALERLIEAELQVPDVFIVDDNRERAPQLQSLVTRLGQASELFSDFLAALKAAENAPSVNLVLLGFEAVGDGDAATEADDALHRLGIPAVLVYDSMFEFEVAMLEDSCHFSEYLCWPAPSGEGESVLSRVLGLDLDAATSFSADAAPGNPSSAALDLDDLVDDHRETRLVVQIPSLSGGNLSNLPLPRLLYFMAVQRRTGILTLSRSGQQLQVALRDGWLVQHENDRSAQAVQAAFSWENGEFRFEWDTITGGKPLPLLDFIAEGIQQYISFNTLLLQLSKYQSLYPAYTSLFLGRYKAFARLPDVIEAARVCRGQQNLGEILRLMQGRYESFAPALAFCVHVDAVGMLDAPGNAPVGITYSLHDRLGEVSGARAQKPALLGKTMLGFKPQATHVQIQSMSRSQFMLLNTYEKIQTYLIERDPYASFDLFPGCGRDAVRSRFKHFNTHLPELPQRFPAPLRVTARLVAAALQDAYLLLMAQETTDPPQHSGDTLAQLQTAGLDQHLSALSPLYQNILTELAPESPPEPSPAVPLLAPTPSSPVERVKPFSQPALRPVSKAIVPPKRPSVVRFSSIVPPEDLLDDILEGPEIEPLEPEPLEPEPLEPEPLEPTAKEHFEIGLQKLQSNAFQDAREAFRLALKADADNGLYLAYEAWSAYLQNPEQSTASVTRKLRKARRMTGGLEMACYFMGSIALQSNAFEEARRFLKRALRENPDNYEAEQKLRLVQLREEQAAKGSGGGLFGKLFKDR